MRRTTETFLYILSKVGVLLKSMTIQYLDFQLHRNTCWISIIHLEQLAMTISGRLINTELSALAVQTDHIYLKLITVV